MCSCHIRNAKLFITLPLQRTQGLNIQVPSRLNVIVQVSQVQPTNAGHTMTDVSTACAQVIIRVKVNFASLAHS